MSTTPIDVPRLLRLAGFLLTCLTGCLIYFTYEPQVEAAQSRLADAESSLLSQDVAFAALPRLRLELASLERRYDTSFLRSPEATFLRELASTLNRDAVSLVSTSFTQDDASDANPGEPAIWKRTKVALELRGTYGHLLESVRDLSHGSAIVGVDPPTLRRDGNTLLASIPITIYEPAGTLHAEATASTTAP